MIKKNNKNRKEVNPIFANRVPPNSIDAEVAVLGAMMLSSHAISKASEILERDSFYIEKHKLIFDSILNLSKKNISVDILTLTEDLKSNGSLEDAGGLNYILEINQQVPTSSNIEQYAFLVLEKKLRRDLIDTAGHIINNSYDETIDVLEEIDHAESEIFKIAERRLTKSFKSMKDLSRDTYTLIENLRASGKTGISGVPSGLTELDKLTGGFQDSDLIIVAARPSMGKTALALSILRNMAIEFKKSIGFFSIEMASTQLIMRLISAEAKIDQQKVRTGRINDREDQKIIDALGKLSNANIFIDDSPMLTILEFRAKCRRLKVEHDIDAVFVDYLQLLHSPGAESREREISNISMTLKQIAKELNIPVIALAQLNRSAETRTTGKKSKIPMLSDLRESGSIEQDADVVIFVHRRERYGEEEYEDGTPTAGTGELIIGKQRNGPTGLVRVAFQNDYARFENLSYAFDEPPPGFVNKEAQEDPSF